MSGISRCPIQLAKLAEFIAVSLTGVLEKEETSTLLTALFSILALIASFVLLAFGIV